MTTKTNSFKTKLRKGDEVIVLSGKDKGKTGKIESFITSKNRAFVKGVNLIKDTKKARSTEDKSQIITREASIHISNIAFLSDDKKSPSKLGYVINDGSKKRINKKDNKVI